jgi:rare lipoprotein A
MLDVRDLMLLFAAGFLAGGATVAHGEPPPAKPAPQTGIASYFGPELTGKTTASGTTVKAGAMTAASPTLPLGTTAKVTNAETGQSVHVTVTDRGPYAKGRILDVSPKAAGQLGMKEDGVAKVRVQPVTVPPKPKVP